MYPLREYSNNCKGLLSKLYCREPLTSYFFQKKKKRVRTQIKKHPLKFEHGDGKWGVRHFWHYWTEKRDGRDGMDGVCWKLTLSSITSVTVLFMHKSIIYVSMQCMHHTPRQALPVLRKE